MKKLYIILAAILLSISAFAEKRMIVELKSGEKIRYNVEDIDKVKVAPKSFASVTGQIDGYDYVDLGLESGTLWATYNVGAASPIEVGSYFAWAETSPKETYEFDNYKWLNSDYDYSKYANGPCEFDDADDAAKKYLSKKWETPSLSDFSELQKACKWIYVKDYMSSGVSGYLGTSNNNGETIFFPATGYMDEVTRMSSTIPYYMTGSCNKKAYIQYVGLETAEMLNRYYGFAVRAIAKIKIVPVQEPQDAKFTKDYLTSVRSKYVVLDAVANHTNLVDEAKPTKLTDVLYQYNVKDTCFFLNMTNGKIVLDKDMSGAFENRNYLLGVSFKDVVDMSKVEDLSNMFKYCERLLSIDWSGKDMSSVVSMANMFEDCSSLESVNLSHVNTVNLKTTNQMFYECNKLTTINLTNFVTDNVTDMDLMFVCSIIEELDLSSFSTSKVETMSGMFYSRYLKTIYAGEGFVTTNVVNQKETMFNCSNLVGGQGTKWSRATSSVPYARIDGGEDSPGLFTAKK